METSSDGARFWDLCSPPFRTRWTNVVVYGNNIWPDMDCFVISLFGGCVIFNRADPPGHGLGARPCVHFTFVEDVPLVKNRLTYCVCFAEEAWRK